METDEDKVSYLLQRMVLQELKMLANEVGIEVKPALFTGRLDEARYREVLEGSGSVKLERLIKFLEKANPKLLEEWQEREESLSFDWKGVKEKLRDTLKQDVSTLLEAASAEKEKEAEQLEDLIEGYFKSKRYRVLKRNWNVEGREIDLIVARGAKAIMVETKFRKKPLSLAEHDGYKSLFKKIKRRKLEGETYIEKLLYIAPLGGVSNGVMNDARTSDGEYEIWGLEFRQTLIEFQKRLREA